MDNPTSNEKNVVIVNHRSRVSPFVVLARFGMSVVRIETGVVGLGVSPFVALVRFGVSVVRIETGAVGGYHRSAPRPDCIWGQGCGWVGRGPGDRARKPHQNSLCA